MYIILFLHQTTTFTCVGLKYISLYIILFLHQTTTLSSAFVLITGCISSFSYIKPQLPHIGCVAVCSCISSFSYIKPQLWDIKTIMSQSCISSFSYIKPQLIDCIANIFELYIILFLHQTTTIDLLYRNTSSCISSFSYIKPQPLVSGPFRPMSCISSFSYIKPQPDIYRCLCKPSCISSFSYIKPQHPSRRWSRPKVVYHPFPTSNHNRGLYQVYSTALYIILFLHQTTTYG